LTGEAVSKRDFHPRAINRSSVPHPLTATPRRTGSIPQPVGKIKDFQNLNDIGSLF
jgi:hypothetical protein